MMELNDYVSGEQVTVEALRGMARQLPEFSGLPPGSTVYLSGPMRGYPEFNYNTFNAAAELLRAMGLIVFSPAESFGGNTTLPRLVYMIIDRAAVQVCDAVVVLPAWALSPGAREECHIALTLKKPILHLVDPTNGVSWWGPNSKAKHVALLPAL
jgi:hypothetical protein